MRKLIALMVVVAAPWLGACGDNSEPNTGEVSLSTTTVPGSAARGGSFMPAPVDTIGDGVNQLVITKAEVVLREVELERVETGDCDSEPEPAGCEEFEAGPMLLDLPLDGSTAQVVTVVVPPGSYNEVEFDVHKVSNDDPEDAAFRQAHPDMVEKSIRVQGTFNGEAFTYETDLNEEQELALIPPLELAKAGATNVTVRLDLSVWFQDGSGSLIDPRTANAGGPNENLVENNIRNSIEAFEDQDRDGDDSD